MKRSEIAASKRDMQVLLEQQERNWKTKFFVNSSENILEQAPTHPSDYNRPSGMNSSSRSRASPRSATGSDNADDSSPCYRTPYHALEVAKNVTSKPSSASTLKPFNPPSNARTSIAAAPDPKQGSSSTTTHHRRSNQASPTGTSLLTQRALESKEREIRELEAELARLRERVGPISGNPLNVSARGSRSRDSSTSRTEQTLTVDNGEQHNSRHGSSDSNTMPRKHKRDHSMDRLIMKHHQSTRHHVPRNTRVDHHIRMHNGPFTSQHVSIHSNRNPLVGAAPTTTGSESDSGISSTNHTPKDYASIQGPEPLNPLRSSSTITSSSYSRPTVKASSGTTAQAGRLKSTAKVSPSVLPNNLCEEIELREDHIKILECEKQRLEECLTSKDERIRLLEAQVTSQQQTTSSQMTSRSGSYLPHHQTGTINGTGFSQLDSVDGYDKDSSMPDHSHLYAPYHRVSLFQRVFISPVTFLLFLKSEA